MTQKPTSATPPTTTPAARAATTEQPAARIGTDATAPDAAATAVSDAVRKAEIDRLTEQRDELRELIGDAPTLAVLRAEVDALQQVAAQAGVSRSTRFTMSAGVASDLEQTGVSVDPANGDAYVRDGDRVKVTSRAGESRTVAMPDPSGAGDRDAKPAGQK